MADKWDFTFRDRRLKLGYTADRLLRVYPANVQEIKYGNNQSIYVYTGVNMEQENMTKDAFGNELHSVKITENQPESLMNKPNNYLKFRIEVLPGNWLLFQVLEMDERFRSKSLELTNSLNINDISEIRSYSYPSISNKDKTIYLRGCDKLSDLLPSFLKIETSPEMAKKDILGVLSNFWRWEGFKNDFKESKIEIYEASTLKNANGEHFWLSDFDSKAKRFVFRRISEITEDGYHGYDYFLDYQVWEKDDLTFFKVNYADDCFMNIAFYKNRTFSSPLQRPSIFPLFLVFKGYTPECDFNTDFIKSQVIEFCTGKVNEQVLKFLNEKFQTKNPELIEAEPNSNIYELRKQQ